MFSSLALVLAVVLLAPGSGEPLPRLSLGPDLVGETTPERPPPEAPSPGAGPAPSGDGTEGPAASQGELVSAAYPHQMAEELRFLGYRAEVSTDSVGDPMITSAASGLRYAIYFYDCLETHIDCGAILFSVGLDLPDGLSPERMAEWNRTRLVGRGYLDDEGDPYIEWFVTTRGGLTPENFADAVDRWVAALDGFKEFTEF